MCYGCYWQDQCGDGLGCDDYTPLNPDYSREYREDLELRGRTYENIVKDTTEI